MKIDEKNKRKHDIVLTAVDDFIKTAQPITSGGLNAHFKDISSATLRNELNALESMGYFRQLHTSGGRVPTSLAYKEYVNSLLDSDKLDYNSIKNVLSNYEDKSVSLISTLSTLAKRLSRATNCPTVLVQHGLQNLTIENIQIIRPSRPLGGFLDFDRKTLDWRIRLGYLDTLKAFHQLHGHRFAFTDQRE